MPSERSGNGGGGEEGYGDDGGDGINLAELDITTTEHSFEDVDGHIQANLEDEIVKEALDKVRLFFVDCHNTSHEHCIVATFQRKQIKDDALAHHAPVHARNRNYHHHHHIIITITHTHTHAHTHTHTHTACNHELHLHLPLVIPVGLLPCRQLTTTFLVPALL